MNKRQKKKRKKWLCAKNTATFFQTMMFCDDQDWVDYHTQYDLADALFHKSYRFAIGKANDWLRSICRTVPSFEAVFTGTDLSMDEAWNYPNGHFAKRLKKRAYMTVADSDLAVWWQFYYSTGILRPTRPSDYEE